MRVASRYAFYYLLYMIRNVISQLTIRFGHFWSTQYVLSWSSHHVVEVEVEVPPDTSANTIYVSVVLPLLRPFNDSFRLFLVHTICPEY